MCSIQIYAPEIRLLIVLKHYKQIKIFKLVCTWARLFFILLSIGFLYAWDMWACKAVSDILIFSLFSWKRERVLAFFLRRGYLFFALIMRRAELV
jgi:hypothetical protein